MGSPLAVSYDSDGMSISRFEERSAAKSGSSIQEWRQKVQDSLLKSKDKQLNAAGKFLQDRKFTDLKANPADNNSALKELLDRERYEGTQAPAIKGTKELPTDSLPSQRSMWGQLYKQDKAHSLVDDPAWQYKASASFVSKGADGKVTSRSYPDPELTPYIAKHGKNTDGAHLGAFMKITDPKDPNNPLPYARIYDAGPPGEAKTEVSLAAGRNFGDTNPNPGVGPANDTSRPLGTQTISDNPYRTSLNTDKVYDTRTSNLAAQGGGKGDVQIDQKVFSADSQLDNANTQYAGWLAENKGASYDQINNQAALDKTLEKYKDDPAFQAYKKRVQEAIAKQKADKAAQMKGADQVKSGITTISVGEDRKQIVTATSPTMQGDTVTHGKFGVYAGPAFQPVSTIGSATLEQQAVVSGVDHVIVYGMPTAAPAVIA
jgi:hypothetical protein